MSGGKGSERKKAEQLGETKEGEKIIIQSNDHCVRDRKRGGRGGKWGGS